MLAALLVWALKNAPLSEIAATLRRLTWPQAAALLALNLLIFLLLTARWWLIVRAQTRLPFWPFLAYRLTAFGISYFTPGPQFGGEPYQILVLQKNHGLSAARAAAAVVLDKLLEFLANFIFLAIGLFALARSGLWAQISAPAWVIFPLMALLLWPPLHIFLLYRQIHPVSAALNRLRRSAIFSGRAALQRAIRLVTASEHLAATFCHRHPQFLLAALGVSLLSWLGMLAEYALMTRFLRLPLLPLEIVSALTLARLAFLAPLPAGIGALEASQALALTALGWPAASGISLSLLMRARDLLLGGAGLLLGAIKK
ncbi:MAG: hypothetical protein OHK0031_17350 [Anaerolineales bacterium]